VAYPGIDVDDQVAIDAYRASRSGDGGQLLAVEEVPWNGPRQRDATFWRGFDLVLLRSPWDYPKHYEEFIEWLRMLEKERVRVLNGVRLAVWNSDKAYLGELAAQGLPVAETEFVGPRVGASQGAAQQQSESLAQLSARRGWADIVVKPAISNGAYRTVRLRGAAEISAYEVAFREAAGKSRLLVQPFLEDIKQRGEWSLIYIGGSFSHAVNKRPADSEFRVQENYGGRNTGHAQVEHHLAKLGDAVVGFLKARFSADALLYVRVDMVELGAAAQPVVMEVEALEPSLYFKYDVSGKAGVRFLEAAARTAHV
jgi:glutathione synthase/RimK-type ligase-like ATP-grasp enzyme